MSGDAVTQVLSRFAPDQYERVLAVMADSALLPLTHAAWRQGFDERLAALARRAVRPIVVTIDPEAFVSWCAAHDLPCDAHARLEYAESLAARSSPWPERETLLRLPASPPQPTPAAPPTRRDADALLAEAAA